MFKFVGAGTRNYFVSFLKKIQRKAETDTPVDPLVRKFSHINPDNPKRAFVKTGRPWEAAELRLKSSEDLTKLYYVCLKERNTILADQALRKKLEGRSGQWNSLRKLKITVARLLTVLSQRNKLRVQYRQKLEKQYIQQKRNELVEATNNLNDPDVPEITWKLMKQKQRDLRKGIDNVAYIQRQFKIDEKRKANRQKMLQNIQKLPQSFDSYFQTQLDTNNYKPSQEQVLKSNIKNWRMLGMKQRRIVLGFLNARRARDARTAFLKQVKQLGQKIKYDSQKQA